MNLYLPSSSGPRYDGESTWAARGSGSAVGALRRITDIGPAGLLTQWDGTYWRALAPFRLLFDTSTSTGSTSGVDQVVKSSGSLPAGILRLGREIEIRINVGKNGTTDAVTASRLRIGTADTTSDAELWSQSVMNAAARQRSYRGRWFLQSATVMRNLGTTNLGLPEEANDANSTVADPVDKTIADADANALFIHQDVDMAGTTNAPQVHRMSIILHP